MSFWSWLTGGKPEAEYRNRGDRNEEAARTLSVAMPMAGAGAALSGKSEKSETEKALSETPEPPPARRD